MSKVQISNIQAMNKPQQRAYIVKITSKECITTEVAYVDYGTNGEEWKAVKFYVDTRLGCFLDDEPHEYFVCGMVMVDPHPIEFKEEKDDSRKKRKRKQKTTHRPKG